MLANIRVIVTVFCIAYFVTIPKVDGAPSYNDFKTHSFKICATGYSYDYNAICNALANTYDPSFLYSDKSKIKGNCQTYYFAFPNSAAPGGVMHFTNYILNCDIGPSDDRCVTTTGTSGSYDAWGLTEMTLRNGSQVTGCSYLKNFTA